MNKPGRVFSRIAGTGGYLPEKILSNFDLEKIVNTSNEWIVERTGIRNRHIVAEDETASTMGYVAAKQALDAARLSVDQIDCVIVSTSTPDKIFPSTACIIQDKLGIPACPAFDVSAACAGFMYALDIADKFIRTGAAKHALVIGSEAMSRILDWQDRKTCVLFGDGAGAIVLSASETPGIRTSNLGANGAYKEMLYVSNGFANQDELSQPSCIYMQGSEVFRVAVRTLGRIFEEIIAEEKMAFSDIDWLIPHQANLRIISAMANKLSLPLERVILTIAEQGNTSAASIPLALHQGITDGRIQRGDHLLLEGFGGGFAWGAALVNY